MPRDTSRDSGMETFSTARPGLLGAAAGAEGTAKARVSVSVKGALSRSLDGATLPTAAPTGAAANGGVGAAGFFFAAPAAVFATGAGQPKCALTIAPATSARRSREPKQ